MNFFLFVLEIFLVVAGIALVPARSELRISRTRVIHNERERENSLRF
jgi:P pilus assembly chaperone PapD